MTFLRRFARFILSLVAVACAFVALAAVGVNQAVGTADRAAATIGAVIDSEHGPQALGAAFVDMLKQTGGSDVVLTADDETLAKAAGVAISAQRDTIVAAVRTAYEANVTGQAATIDLTPVFAAIATELHAVDPGVPADIGSGSDGPGTLSIAASANPPLATVNKALGFWWLALLVAAVLLAAVAFLAPQGGWRRWRASGLMLAGVGLVWLAASKSVHAVTVKAVTDPVALNVADQVGPRLVAPLAMVGGTALLLGAALAGLSWRSVRPAGAHSGVPVVPSPGPDASHGGGGTPAGM